MATASVVNRRDFLKKSAAGGTALVIGFYLPAVAHPQEARSRKRNCPIRSMPGYASHPTIA